MQINEQPINQPSIKYQNNLDNFINTSIPN